LPFRRRRPNPFKGKQAYKHVVTNEAQGDFSAAVTTVEVILGVDNPLIANTTNVQVKAKCIGVYMEVIYSYALVPANVKRNDLHWVLYYSPQGLISGSNVNPLTQGTQQAKTYVIKSGVLSINDPGMCTTKVAGYVSIPKKFRSYMLGDKLRFAFISSVGTGNAAEFISTKFIYKELRG